MYRLSRNVEATIVHYLEDQLTADGWSGIRVEKTFNNVYKGTLPCICVMLVDRPDNRREVSSDELSKRINVDIRIFADSDGVRLDLADWLLENIFQGINYYQYVDGERSTRTLAGRLNILEVTQNRRELVITDNLAEEDRYRHILSLRCRVSLI